MERVDAMAVDRPRPESDAQKLDPLTHDHRGPVAAGLEWITASEPRPRKKDTLRRGGSPTAHTALHPLCSTKPIAPCRSVEGTASAHTD